MASSARWRSNWAGNVRYRAARCHRPASVPQLQRLVARARQIRAAGTGHSFSALADTAGDLVTLSGLAPRVRADAERGTVTVSAGLRYADITGPLRAAGLALPNLASLPHVSVAGAVATGSHGSGDGCGSLAAAVSGLELVTASGDLARLSRDSHGGQFDAFVVSLGALGIVTRLTLDTVPAFEVSQHVYEDLPLEQVAGHFDEITASGYSVSLFTTWRRPRVFQAWLKRRTGQPGGPPPGPGWLGGRPASQPRHPIPGLPAAHCTGQLGVPGPWDERLPHFRPDAVPSAGAELQSEYLLPRAAAVRGLRALDQVAAELAPVVQVCEIRTLAADRLWLSPGYQRASAAFHFTWAADPAAVTRAMALIEAQLEPLAPRPHWGKLFGISPRALAGRYPRLPDFGQLMTRWDPDGKFRNELLERYLLPAGPDSHP
ncbi:MAG TPA: D-arabinono-1,4-lactone oxidase [Streptosporangiaceae bacterium]|jgi:xylitol oxidase